MIRTPIQIAKTLHERIKTQSNKEKLTIGQFIMKIFNKYMASLCLLLLVSCGTTKYVQVDPVNYTRFNHGQKMIEGLTRQEVLSKFGSPDSAEETIFGAVGAIRWRYHEKIFCAHLGTRCDVYFRNDVVVYSNNFRMEFSNTVVDNN